jgi:hypothetical protein
MRYGSQSNRAPRRFAAWTACSRSTFHCSDPGWLSPSLRSKNSCVTPLSITAATSRTSHHFKSGRFPKKTCLREWPWSTSWTASLTKWQATSASIWRIRIGRENQARSKVMTPSNRRPLYARVISFPNPATRAAESAASFAALTEFLPRRSGSRPGSFRWPRIPVPRRNRGPKQRLRRWSRQASLRVPTG